MEPQEKNSKTIGFIALALLGVVAGAWALGIQWPSFLKHDLPMVSVKFSPGMVRSHDIYVTNTTGKDLTDVQLDFIVSSTTGGTTVNRQWPTWPLGQTMDVKVAVGDVTDVKTIVLSGAASQGKLKQACTIPVPTSEQEKLSWTLEPVMTDCTQ